MQYLCQLPFSSKILADRLVTLVEVIFEGAIINPETKMINVELIARIFVIRDPTAVAVVIDAVMGFVIKAVVIVEFI